MEEAATLLLLGLGLLLLLLGDAAVAMGLCARLCLCCVECA